MLRDIFEETVGLTARARERLGLDIGDAGFLRRYVTAHGGAIDQLVSPRQFEELVAEMFRCEGWACSVTRYSKDGGVDIECTRPDVDGETAVLVQVKRYRATSAANTQLHPVGLDEVKAFAATVCGDGKNRGVLVTTSRFTRGAIEWAKGKGCHVAELALFTGSDVKNRLRAIAHQQQPRETAAYEIL